MSLHRIFARRHWLIPSTIQIPKISFEILQVAPSLSPTIYFNYFCAVVASSLSSIIINWPRKLSKSLSQFIIFLIQTAILALHVYYLLSCCCYVISVFHHLNICYCASLRSLSVISVASACCQIIYFVSCDHSPTSLSFASFSLINNIRPPKTIRSICPLLSCRSSRLGNRSQVCRSLRLNPFLFLPSLLPLPPLTKVLPTLIGLVGGEAAVGEVSCGAAFDMRMSLGGWTGLKSATVLVTGKVFPTVGTFGTGTESSYRRMWTCGFFA